MKEPKVGETYYCVPNNQRWNKPEYITVEKVGRKYFYANHLRFDKETFFEYDGKYSPSCRLYDSKEQYDLSIKAGECWREISHRLYRNMTDQEIIELYEKLKDRKL